MSCGDKQINALTVIPVEKCTFTWNIQNFSMCFSKNAEELLSPEFTPGSSYSTTWRLKLFPNGTKESKEGNISIFLERTSNDSIAHFTQCRFSFFSSNKTEISTRDFKHVFEKNESAWGFPVFIKRETLLGKFDLKQDVLMVVCELKVSRLISELDKVVSISPLAAKISEIKTLSDDFGKLYNNPEYSDFTLRVGDEVFQVHRNVLSARSSYFSRMLKQEMKEKISSSVDIVDFDSQVIKKMLEYIYTGKVGGLTSEQANKLYSVADRYELCNLKKLCVEFLLSHLTIYNICDVLLLADLHDDSNLMNAAKNFYCIHSASILETKKWLGFSARKQDLIFNLNKEVILRSRGKYVSK